MEAIELHHSNMKKEDVFCLSDLLICSVEDYRKLLSEDSRDGLSNGKPRPAHTAYTMALSLHFPAPHQR